MGICGSTLTPQERAQFEFTKKLDKQIKDEKKQDETEIKLLLLGAGESGKSTIFRQLKVIHNQDAFPAEERAGFFSVVHNNLISCAKALVTNLTRFDLQVAPENQEAIAYVSSLRVDQPLPPEGTRFVKALWADPAIQKCYEMRSQFQLYDCCKYFMDQVDTVTDPNYLPTLEDILRVRVRTTGIVEMRFIIKEIPFKMVDVGGQRNERKKWIHCFENVTAVIFVAALSEYDQVLYEDDSQNRMLEALTLFDEICNSRWFQETAIILFLNKKDLFAEKIVRVDMAQYFPDYTGGFDFEKGLHFLTNKFLSQNKTRGKDVYTHVTCATDRSNIQLVFDATTNIILKNNLRGSGFMS